MDATTPSSTTALWARLRAIFARAFAAAPVLVACATLRVAILNRLRMLESLARKLLLAEASALHLFDRAAPSVVKRTRRAARAISRGKPETHLTTFSLRLPREPRASCRRQSRPTRNFWDAPAQAHPSAINIARRIEALRDVLNDPAPYARRLARTLIKVHVRRPRVVMRCALAAPRRHVADPEDPRMSFDVVSIALAAAARFENSS